MLPTGKELRLLKLVAEHGPLDHWDSRLDEFCEQNAEKDTFNRCHAAGWLKTWVNQDDSTVEITDVGRGAIYQDAAEAKYRRGVNGSTDSI